MKTAKLIIDGKEIAVQLTDEQMKELITSKKVTGFERNDDYFYIDSDGDVASNYDANDIISDDHYEVANYYADRSLAEWCAQSDNLTRRMRRWAAEHNSKPFSFNDDEIKWCISWSDSFESTGVNFRFSNIGHGEVYFKTQEIAEAAIKEFGDEIKWLTENRPKWF